jgi:hypothetical protein
MRTEKCIAFPLIASGMLLVVAGAVCKHYALFDEIANRSLPYLFGMLGVSALVVGAQCALFGCAVGDLSPSAMVWRWLTSHCSRPARPAAERQGVGQAGMRRQRGARQDREWRRRPRIG